MLYEVITLDIFKYICITSHYFFKIMDNFIVSARKYRPTVITSYSIHYTKLYDYKLIAHSDTYYLLEVNLETGRHHQIRCQLAKMGCPIKGDLKYGFPRSNPNGGSYNFV